jgi:hypothetical protein
MRARLKVSAGRMLCVSVSKKQMLFLKTGEFYSTYETKASTRTEIKTYLFSLLLKNVR